MTTRGLSLKRAASVKAVRRTKYDQAMYQDGRYIGNIHHFRSKWWAESFGQRTQHRTQEEALYELLTRSDRDREMRRGS